MKYNVSLAPMVDRTDVHFRNLVAMINQDITLYTEMITTTAIINGNYEKLLRIGEYEKNVVLQIATSSLSETKKACQIIKKYPYKEINLNVGCPSDRVSNYLMGAALMSKPFLVKDIVRIIEEETGKKVTIKNRIGIDGTGILENDKVIKTYNELLEFIDITNVEKYIIHARMAILKGLNPKENRTIPPLDYEMVYNLKKDRKDLIIEINGGIKTIYDINEHINKVDGIMIGRAFYDNPMLANEINKINNKEVITYEKLFEKIFQYMKYLEETNESIHYFFRHTHGLFYNTKYSKIWKNTINGTKYSSKNILDFFNNIS